MPEGHTDYNHANRLVSMMSCSTTRSSQDSDYELSGIEDAEF